MLILSRVCVDFKDRRGNVIFSVTPRNRLTFVNAPEAIQEDAIFSLLIAEGSLEVAVPAKRKRELEGEPMAGADASGKRNKKTAGPGAGADPRETEADSRAGGTAEEAVPEADASGTAGSGSGDPAESVSGLNDSAGPAEAPGMAPKSRAGRTRK